MSTIVAKELVEALDVLLRRYEAIHGPDAGLNVDYYWSIPAPARYDVYTSPTDHTVGQISEDIEFVRRAVRDPDDVSGRALVRLAHIIEALGDAA